MSAGESHSALVKQLVEDRMLEWKCRVENPQIKVWNNSVPLIYVVFLHFKSMSSQVLGKAFISSYYYKKHML
jgi:hypothetical protein